MSSAAYTVELLLPAEAELRRCDREAIRLRIRPEFAATFQAIIENLSRNPVSWGDPLQDLPGAKVRIYRRVFEKMLTEYAVHENDRVVWVRVCRPVLGHPLAPSS